MDEAHVAHVDEGFDGDTDWGSFVQPDGDEAR